MSPDAMLLAWIQPLSPDGFDACFVAAEAARGRPPATRRFASRDEATRWLVGQADEIGAMITWTDEAAGRG